MIKSIGSLTLNVNTKKKVSDISFNTYGKILEDIKPQINLLVHWVESQWGWSVHTHWNEIGYLILPNLSRQHYNISMTEGLLIGISTTSVHSLRIWSIMIVSQQGYSSPLYKGWSSPGFRNFHCLHQALGWLGDSISLLFHWG